MSWLPLLAFAAGMVALVPQDLFYEAEAYSVSHDTGGEPITVVSCSYASGGLAVRGVDSPGDWVGFALSLTQRSAVTHALRSAGDVDLVRHWVVEYWSAGQLAAADTLVTVPGLGAG